MELDQWTAIDEYDNGGEENRNSSKKLLGWTITSMSWIAFLIGVVQMLDTNNANWFLVSGLVFWLIANYKVNKQTGEEML